MLEGIGSVFVSLFRAEKISPEAQDLLITDLWNLRLLCPKVLVVYAISETKKVIFPQV
jgi:hypothetical protein